MTSAETIYVVDDDKSVADSLNLLLESVGYNVNTFYDSQEVLNSSVHKASLFLLDVRMPKIDGLELLQKLRAKKVMAPIVMITGHGDIEMAVHAIKSGAAHFIEKPYRENVLLNTLKQCLKEASEEPSAREPNKIDAAVRAQINELSQRHLEILKLIGKGHSSKEIGQILGITSHTVDNHRSLIKTRLGINSLTEIVRLACLIDS